MTFITQTTVVNPQKSQSMVWLLLGNVGNVLTMMILAQGLIWNA